MHSARNGENARKDARGVRLEAALSLFLGRGKIKFHQHAESQLHSPLLPIFVGFIFQKDACLGLLEIADGSQFDFNQYIVFGTKLTFGSLRCPIIEVLCTFPLRLDPTQSAWSTHQAGFPSRCSGLQTAWGSKPTKDE